MSPHRPSLRAPERLRPWVIAGCLAGLAFLCACGTRKLTEDRMNHRICTANLMTLGSALLMFKEDKGRLPEDLSETSQNVLKRQRVLASILKCPNAAPKETGYWLVRRGDAHAPFCPRHGFTGRLGPKAGDLPKACSYGDSPRKQLRTWGVKEEGLLARCSDSPALAPR